MSPIKYQLRQIYEIKYNLIRSGRKSCLTNLLRGILLIFFFCAFYTFRQIENEQVEKASSIINHLKYWMGIPKNYLLLSRQFSLQTRFDGSF